MFRAATSGPPAMSAQAASIGRSVSGRPRRPIITLPGIGSAKCSMKSKRERPATPSICSSVSAAIRDSSARTAAPVNASVTRLRRRP